jgi:hypothetical protein
MNLQPRHRLFGDVGRWGVVAGPSCLSEVNLRAKITGDVSHVEVIDADTVADDEPQLEPRVVSHGTCWLHHVPRAQTDSIAILRDLVDIGDADAALGVCDHRLEVRDLDR